METSKALGLITDIYDEFGRCSLICTGTGCHLNPVTIDGDSIGSLDDAVWVASFINHSQYCTGTIRVSVTHTFPLTITN